MSDDLVAPEICGAVKTFPDTPEAAAEGLAGLTIKCAEGPHADPAEAIHCAEIFVDGDLWGTFFWGPGHHTLSAQ